MLRPARWLARLSSPRRCFAPTGAPVYYRACPARSLLQAKSVITTRPNHLLPRRDSHPLACQRTKAAPEGNQGNEGTLNFMAFGFMVKLLSSLCVDAQTVSVGEQKLSLLRIAPQKLLLE